MSWLFIDTDLRMAIPQWITGLTANTRTNVGLMPAQRLIRPPSIKPVVGQSRVFARTLFDSRHVEPDIDPL